MAAIKAIFVAIAVVVALIVSIYISYLLVPILVLIAVFGIAYALFSEDDTTPKTPTFKSPY